MNSRPSTPDQRPLSPRSELIRFFQSTWAPVVGERANQQRTADIDRAADRELARRSQEEARQAEEEARQAEEEVKSPVNR